MRSTTVTTVFQQVSRWGTKTCKCPKCGKRLKRSKTFSQTINPWNRNNAGAERSELEIKEELIIEANEWRSKAELCSKCK